jgi:CTP:molybdopterin cytidylyltransferase MocA
VSQPTLVILAAGQAKRYGGVKPLAPIGRNGEAVIDLLANDALDAGFTEVVVVLNPTTGPQIEAHIAEHWDRDRLHVRFATQSTPGGTVHAVLSARAVLGDDPAIAVSNADDLYGPAALAHLAGHLARGSGNAMVAFELAQTLVGESPVTRGICHIDAEGLLVGIDERRGVHRSNERIVVDDDRNPNVLPANAPVSMNLWAFDRAMWEVFASEMAAKAPDEAEVLLPVVADRLLHGQIALADPSLAKFTVFRSHEHCVGVTHPEDLELVQAHIAEQIELGNRIENLVGALYR